MSTLEIRGLDEFMADITRYPDQALDAGKVAMNHTLLFLHGQIPGYPPPPGPETPSPLQTPKQRRWFFAALREGRITVPYRRGGTLGRTFTENVEVSGDEVTGTLGTNRPYAPWVVGPDYPGETIQGQTMFQALVHQGRWWQFHEIIERNADDAENEFVTSFWQELERLIGD